MIRKVVVASQNQVKVDAVKEVLADYSFLSGCPVESASVVSSVGEQPIGFDKTIEGARERSKAVYEPGSLGVGIESGLVKLPGIENKFFDMCICCLFDDRGPHFGTSCGFVLPPKVAAFILEDGKTLQEAIHLSGMTRNTRLGCGEGTVGLLTRGRISRKSYTKQAITTALISLENDEWYN